VITKSTADLAVQGTVRFEFWNKLLSDEVKKIKQDFANLQYLRQSERRQQIKIGA
jgi:hypothetical protein